MALGFTQQVAQWAASKPADERYDYNSNDNCALCQFLKEQGYTDIPLVGATRWTLHDAESGWNDIDDRLADALRFEPHTFGALADRLSA